MLRAREEVGGRLGLHDEAVVHHRDTGRYPAHYLEVVRDEEDSHADLALELLEELEYLGLDGHVEGGGGLVGDEEARLVGEGHRYHHALALTPR